MAFGPKSRDPREQRAWTHALISRARESGSEADFMRAYEAVVVEGNRKTRASGFLGALLAAHPPTRSLVRAFDFLQTQAYPLVPFNDPLVRGNWQRVIGTPNSVPTGVSGHLQGDTLSLCYVDKTDTVPTAFLVQKDMGDDYNYSIGHIPLKDGVPNIQSIRSWNETAALYGAVAEKLVAMHTQRG